MSLRAGVKAADVTDQAMATYALLYGMKKEGDA